MAKAGKWGRGGMLLTNSGDRDGPKTGIPFDPDVMIVVYYIIPDFSWDPC